MRKEKGTSYLSRRNFLRLVGVAGGSIVVGGTIGRYMAENHYTDINEISLIFNSENKLETAGQLDNIKANRRKIGLEGLPKYLNSMNTEVWDDSPPYFDNQLPEIDQSYGDQISYILENLLGENGRRNIKGVKVDPVSPHQIAFDHNERMLIMPRSIASRDENGFFYSDVVHEIVHGLDMSIVAKYPADVAVAVEHGKWKILSQIYEIDESELGYPFGLLRLSLGKYFAEHFRSGDLHEQFIDTDDLILDEILLRVISEHNTNIKDLKFNKSVCQSIGVKLIEEIKRGNLKFDKDIASKYESIMENSVLVEMFAEIVNNELRNPHKYNDHVTEGVEEIFSAIRNEPVTIEALNQKLYEMDPELKKRRDDEKILKNMISESADEGQELASISEEEVLQAKTQEKQQDDNHDVYEQFVYKGIYSKIDMVPEEYKNDIENYVSVVATVVANNEEILWASPRFDPWLDIWEIEQIELAANPEFIRVIANEPDRIKENIDHIRNRTQILLNFIQSEAFHTA